MRLSGPAERRVLIVGGVSAAIVYVVPFTRFVFSALVTLFHELGHAVVGWALGVPSLPAFDLVYGGGFTHQGAFKLPLALLVGCGFAIFAFMNRENHTWLAVIGALALVWLFFVTSEWRRELAIAAAGHLAEFVLASAMLYRALTGQGLRNPDVERPIAAFIAFFVQIHSTHFAWKLINDPAFLDWYREGKGGALMNDLEVIALDLQIRLGVQPGIEGVAKALLFFSLVPLAISVLRARAFEDEEAEAPKRFTAPFRRTALPSPPRLLAGKTEPPVASRPRPAAKPGVNRPGTTS